MAKHNELGKDGEMAAVKYLTDRGYRIRDVNWRKGHLELDIVAQTADELVFVEVKTRVRRWDSPDVAVGETKIRRLVAAADWYMRLCGEEELLPRFDVMILLGRSPDFTVRHVERAFYPPIEIHK